MANKPEITYVAAAANCFRSNKIGIRQIAVVDDICMTAHRSEFHQPSFSEYFSEDKLVELKMKFMLRVVLVPGVAPAIARSLLEAERHDLFH